MSSGASLRAAALGVLLAAPAGADAPFSLAYERLGVAAEDLDVRPDRWPTPLTLGPVEDVLRSPAGVGAALRAAGGTEGRTPSERMRDAAAALGGEPVRLELGDLPPDPERTLERLPAEARAPVRKLAAAVWRARFLLRSAVEAAPMRDRERWLAAVRPHVLNQPAARPAPEDFVEAGSYRVEHAAAGAEAVVAAAEEAAQALRGLKLQRKRYDSPVGPILLGGPGDDVYTESDLAAAILVDTGGRNRYQGPAAAAGQGEVRLVLDLGSDVTVEGDGAASGTFGVGVLALLSGGRKTVRSGDVSAGAGLFGAGVLVTPGSCDVETGRFSQGAGAFGVGLLACDGAGSRLKARGAAQGFGFTRGSGALVATGARTALECGLTDPDPRDPNATLALCQGTGYGPRAYAAGGIGLARLEGDGSSARSGYFAQGSGYWHALGVFIARGKGLRLQARRYAQGAGVHLGAGLFVLEASSSSVVNWGVGPAYGWDWGVGWAIVTGDHNRLSTEWGTGHGDVNGHAFALIDGRGNRLHLPGFGSGAAKRFGASYGFAQVLGQDNRLRVNAATAPVRGPHAHSQDPWGWLGADDGLTLAADVAPEAADWPEPDRGAAAASERAALAALLERTESMHRRDAVAQWLSLAGGFGMDDHVPGQAARRLLAMSDEEASFLPGLVLPAHFMEQLWQRLLAAGFRDLGDALARETDGAEGHRKALLAGLLRWRPAREGRRLLVLLSDSDWRVRREAAASLGFLLDGRWGEEPGRRRLLELALDAAQGKGGLKARAGIQRLADLYAVLALHEGFGAAGRLALYEASPTFADPVTQAGFDKFAALLAAEPAYPALVKAELAATAALGREAAPRLRELLKDKEPLVVQAALAALGQNGEAFDGKLLAERLGHPSGAVRETAAAALAAMGAAGRPVIERALASEDPRVRLFALKAAARSADSETVALVARGFEDPDPGVQAMARAAVNAVQAPLAPSRAALVERLGTAPLSW